MSPTRLNRWMQCRVLNVSVNHQTHEARVEIAQNHSTDMGGCIRAVRELDPLVSRITVFAGGVRDITYTKGERGWCAWLTGRES
jgi:hypothetical protein